MSSKGDEKEGAPVGVDSSGEFIGTAEAAKELGVSKSTLRRWLQEGRIKARKVGRQWRFRRGGLGSVVDVLEGEPAATPAGVDRQLARKCEAQLDAVLSSKGLSKRRIAALSKEIETSVREVAPDNDPEAGRLVSKIVLNAVHCTSSDLHFEPMARCLKVRQRVDGLLTEVVDVPRTLSPSVIREVKRWAVLDLDEWRRPQQGRIVVKVESREIDLRVSTLPATNGEAITLYVLDRQVALRSLDQLGLEPDQLERYRRIVHRPNGLVLITGPAGTGRTTVAYATLRELIDPGRKLMTAEAPVEYDLDGVVQAQINDEIGLGFSEVTRTMLRQACNVMFVGEVRDGEVGRLLCQAAVTGHLVLSTMLTSDAPLTITHLLDLGVPPFLLASSLQAILSQRLVRMICEACKEPAEYGPQELDRAGLRPEDCAGATLYRGRGCAACNQTGYRGRTGIFQLLVMDSKLRDLTFHRESTARIRDQAVLNGMRSIQENAVRKVCAGITTVEEVARIMSGGMG